MRTRHPVANESLPARAPAKRLRCPVLGFPSTRPSASHRQRAAAPAETQATRRGRWSLPLLTAAWHQPNGEKRTAWALADRVARAWRCTIAVQLLTSRGVCRRSRPGDAALPTYGWRTAACGSSGSCRRCHGAPLPRPRDLGVLIFEIAVGETRRTARASRRESPHQNRGVQVEFRSTRSTCWPRTAAATSARDRRGNLRVAMAQRLGHPTILATIWRPAGDHLAPEHVVIGGRPFRPTSLRFDHLV